MSNRIEIKKIVIEINGKEIELTVDQARKLYQKLDGLFGSSYTPYPVYPTYPVDPVFPTFPEWVPYSTDNTSDPFEYRWDDNTGSLKVKVDKNA